MQGYKDSGIEWIGKIPIDWKIKKIKHIATEPNTLFIDGDWIESKDISESGIRYLTSGNVGEGEFKRQGEGYVSEETFEKLKCLSVYPGDLMISRLNLPIGRACIVPGDYSIYVVAVDNVILRPNKSYSKKYLMYIMNTNGYSNEAEIISRGTTMKRISRTLLGEMKVCTPSLEEQQKIADFLDKECKRIDRITEKIEKQIEILKEYKKSLIAETVTKGLNKNVKMKDSGVEWIGEVPEYWEIDKVKYIASLYGRIGWQGLTSNEYIEEGPYLITGVDFSKGTIDWNNCVHISEERWNQANKVKIKNGDLLITKDGTVGKVALVNNLIGKASLNSGVLLIDLNIENNKKFLFWVLSSEVFWNWFNYKNSGNSTILHLYQKDFNEFKFAMPSLKEQQQIADFLDQKCSEIDLILSKKANQLDIIKEHKKSLIYEYVTGKKRVGGIENGD